MRIMQPTIQTLKLIFVNFHLCVIFCELMALAKSIYRDYYRIIEKKKTSQEL